MTSPLQSVLADMRRKYLHAKAQAGNPDWLKGDPITAAILERWIPEVERAADRLDALEAALNPLLWSGAMSDAWHQNIPDVSAAFRALRAAALSKPAQQEGE